MNKDEAKGRIKEAAGDLTDDDELKREGQADRAEGKAQEAVDKAGDKVKDALRQGLSTRARAGAAMRPRPPAVLLGSGARER